MSWISLLIAVAFIGWVCSKFDVAHEEGPSPDDRWQPNSKSAIHHWPPSGNRYSIAGCQYRQPEIKSAITKLGGRHDARKVDAVAHLVIDEANPHDDKAVRVDICNTHVGYLSREDAPKFRQRLKSKGIGGQTTNCQAVIWGDGKDCNGNFTRHGVVLDLERF